MHHSTELTRTRTWLWAGLWMPLCRAATVVMVGCLLATGCTSTTGTTQATPAATDVVTPKLADASWRGTFQVDGQLANAPARVGSAGCIAIGRMALDLHQGAIGPHGGGGVSGRLRVWAVTMSGTTGTACGRRDLTRGSLLGTLASDGTHLQADRFRLLGIPYGWLTASITTFPVTPTMQVQQMQGQFGAGRSHHRLLHGSFTLTSTVARTNSRTGERTYPSGSSAWIPAATHAPTGTDSNPFDAAMEDPPIRWKGRCCRPGRLRSQLMAASDRA